MQTITDAPSIRVQNVTPGLVLDFTGMSGQTPELETIALGEAEIISVLPPTALGEPYGLWVAPEEGAIHEAFVAAFDWQSFEIAG